MKTVYFCLSYYLSFPELYLENSIYFNLKNESSVKIEIRNKEDNEYPENTKYDRHVVEATFEVSIMNDDFTAFDLLNRNIIFPSDTDPQLRYRQSDNSIIDYPKIYSDFFPDGFENRIREMCKKYNLEIKKFIKFFRWRLNQTTDNIKIQAFAFNFSMDNEQWNPVPSEGPQVEEISVSMVKPDLPEETKKEIQETLNNVSYIGEPFYHSLFYDAWTQENNFYSSIVMGSMVAESAIKFCISELLPDTEWLLEEIQSPPIDRILKKYIPDYEDKCQSPLKAKEFLDEEGTIAIPRKMRKVLKTGAEIRNKIVHTGKIPIKNEFKKYNINIKESTKNYLLNVRDLIWLIDYYRGNKWAINHVRMETLNSMNIYNIGVSNNAAIKEAGKYRGTVSVKLSGGEIS